jgi:hypothetical protein
MTFHTSAGGGGGGGGEGRVASLPPHPAMIAIAPQSSASAATFVR